MFRVDVDRKTSGRRFSARLLYDDEIELTLARRCLQQWRLLNDQYCGKASVFNLCNRSKRYKGITSIVLLVVGKENKIKYYYPLLLKLPLHRNPCQCQLRCGFGVSLMDPAYCHPYAHPLAFSYQDQIDVDVWVD